MAGWWWFLAGGCTGSGDAHDVAPTDPARVTDPVVTPTPMTPRPGEPPVGLAPTQCDQLADGGAVQGVPGADCVTGKLACGQTVVGHTKGGVRRWDSKFYQSAQCTPQTTNHDSGDERAYLLELPPGDRRVQVYLDTPCADLDLAAMRLDAGPVCGDSLPPQCEMWPKPGTAREHVEMVSQAGSRWLVVVEGKDEGGVEAEGPFALTVVCQDGLY